eukprot:CAMPEP_0201944222 /NCGR_PEP_ID=MMETSP0903-20130614/52696_1 /ASSEMBLY_ACC=CAM_ASM_000552 /TAXON_ID=420261 /ORGANISM="Thalassiosira antarctica, Strain CCMP982" /LENGTH=379 /DNA_ID=CAMNT_0048487151 /DNA_START=73 /DNA_END=1209 /DNA_ORIENTATION=-
MTRTNRAMPRLSLSLVISIISATQAFIPAPRQHTLTPCVTSSSTCQRMSFMADSSDYKPEKSDYGDGGEDAANPDAPLRGEVEMADVPVTEEIPVPMSRNNVGNRFLALVFDKSISDKYSEKADDDGDVLWEMHDDRIALTEDHVMWARKQNLYNETFNTGSAADVLWSNQLLSSDLQRTVGHAMCIDSPTIHNCREALSRDPIIRSLLGVDSDGECDVSSIPLYRWRQIRDHTLRRDDGRDGLPQMVLAFDRPEAKSDGLREEIFNDHLEYLIRSERVISAGPLHVATEEKTDSKSVAVGTLMFFNAPNRDNAVEFVENDPASKAGLYETITVHRYNNLDVTGKFVSENLYFPEQNTYQMKDAMGHWGYPVDDLQTKW